MTTNQKPPSQSERAGYESRGEGPTVYQIRVRGIIGPAWSDWFGGMEIVPLADGQTVMTGPVPDQAALHGILGHLRDLNLPLISIAPVTGDLRSDPEHGAD